MVDMQNEAFRKRLLETFAQEAKEHIDNLSNGLLELKKSSDQQSSKALVETLFREAHSFKGASRSVNIVELEEVCKAMEEVFSHYKLVETKIPDPLLELMLEASDLLSTLSVADEGSRRDQKPHVQEVIARLHKQLEPDSVSVIAEVPIPDIELSQTIEVRPKIQTDNTSSKKRDGVQTDESPKVKEESKAAETIRIPLKKLNAIMEQTEEMLFSKIVSKRHAEMLSSIMDEIGELKKVQSNPHAMMSKLSSVESMMHKAIKQSKGDAREIALSVDRLLAQMKEALTLPFSTLFYTLPKIVHDMAKSVGKEAVLNVIGGEIEIDRRILEEMHDPIIHLLRNAVDHGIETLQERSKKGKSSVGTITLMLNQKSATKVELSVRDDGEGISPEKIILSAIKKGVVDQASAEALDEQSILNLVFQSGITTASSVTDLSGRGLGLAIVQEKAQQLGGHAYVRNKEEGGAEFIVLLPLSMATFRGVVTSLNTQKYIFPSEHISRVMSVGHERIKNVEGKEMVVVDHHVVPFYPLSTILELPTPYVESSFVSVVVIALGNELLAIAVEAIDYEEEVMVKSLGKQLSRVKNIAGVALLASDIPALILNVSDIFKSVGMVSLKRAVQKKEVQKQKSRILVVDDSPTTRALLQNIMEMVGYDVVSAVDGMDAFEALKKEKFDLVVSDVDMPRMNGFELTESIRSDTQHSELPIILVTSLESEEDKEKGMRAGANAYIVKSTFDQNNLLENIQLLID
ncbi:MAG: response regulator [Campylobacterales bacterium]|nr:response regulator [Campylobacterales bacterium]